MGLIRLELVAHWLGGLVAFTTLGIVLAGIRSGARRPAGRTTGRAAGWLRSSVFYVISTALFLSISAALWRPLPLALSAQARGWMLALGLLAYLPGMALVLWGRQALGKMYFVSTSFGAQLYADHRIVMHGPFAIVRHPMYLGLIAVTVGGLLMYRTWTSAFFAIFAPFLILRARREEQALSAQFGQEWELYCRCVPAWLPSWKNKRKA